MPTQDDTSTLLYFVGAQLHADLNCALSAGHGFGHLPVGTLEDDVTQPDWTRLDYADNLRAHYDLSFASHFTPDWVVADIERKLELAVLGDEGVLRTLAAAWPDRDGFDPSWAHTPLTARQLSDTLRDLSARHTHRQRSLRD